MFINNVLHTSLRPENNSLFVRYDSPVSFKLTELGTKNMRNFYGNKGIVDIRLSDIFTDFSRAVSGYSFSEIFESLSLSSSQLREKDAEGNYESLAIQKTATPLAETTRFSVHFVGDMQNPQTMTLGELMQKLSGDSAGIDYVFSNHYLQLLDIKKENLSRSVGMDEVNEKVGRILSTHTS